MGMESVQNRPVTIHYISNRKLRRVLIEVCVGFAMNFYTLAAE